METFTWNHRKNPRGEITYRTLSSQFGDGFSQEVSDGINPRMESWPLEFFGTEAEIQPIVDFLDRHGGWKRFLWTPPAGKEQRFKIKDGKHQRVPLGGGWFTLSVTFESKP